MRRALLVVALFLIGITCLKVHADDMSLLGVSNSKTVSAAGYTGPGDVVASAIAWWGLRGFNSAFSGHVVELCDSGGLNCLNNDWSAGAFTATLSNATGACNNSTNVCRAGIIYDQSGALSCGGSACNINSGTFPDLKTSCIGALSCLVCDGAHGFSTTLTMSANSQPVTIHAAGERTGGFTNFSDLFGSDLSGNIQHGFSDVANNALLYAGTVVSVSGVNDNVFHSIGAVYNGASTIYNIDSATGTVSPGSAGIPSAANPNMCGLGSNGNYNAGFWLEQGEWAGSNSSGTLATLNSQVHNYWGF